MDDYEVELHRKQDELTPSYNILKRVLDTCHYPEDSAEFKAIGLAIRATIYISLKQSRKDILGSLSKRQMTQWRAEYCNHLTNVHNQVIHKIPEDVLQEKKLELQDACKTIENIMKNYPADSEEYKAMDLNCRGLLHIIHNDLIEGFVDHLRPDLTPAEKEMYQFLTGKSWTEE